MGLTTTSPAGYTITGTHPASKPYITSCGVCHTVGSGNPITMGVSTHTNGVLNFNP
jgi:hypothetical protein